MPNRVFTFYGYYRISRARNARNTFGPPRQLFLPDAEAFGCLGFPWFSHPRFCPGFSLKRLVRAEVLVARSVSPTPGDRPSKRLSTAQAKEKFLLLLAEGYKVDQILQVIGRHQKTYEYWRANDAEFRDAVIRMRTIRAGGKVEQPYMPFSEFSERYLGARVFPHMQNVVDLLEGRDPSWLPEGIVYEPGEKDLVLVNMPPEHGKSTTITMNYVAYRIAMDPNIRVLIVSKTQTMAKKFLFGVQERLTHRQYADMIAKYAPAGGFDKDSTSWTQDMFYVSPDVRDAGEKDPTVQALGIRGHIYGARADLIILDDCVDHTNAHEYDKQIDWIQTQVLSRISDAGALLVVGTRLASRDLYAELRKEDYYPEGESPWTYLAMPAVLEFGEKPDDWVTLWPKSNMPVIGAKDDRAAKDEDGLYPKWDGPALAKKRRRMTPENWARIYQQSQTAEDQVFHPDAVRAAINNGRHPGIMAKGALGGTRPEGMEGLLVLAGLDPASPSGFVGGMVVGLDIRTQKRYVLDVWNKTKMTPDDIRTLIKGWTDKYGIVEWRIEKNAFQTMLTQDREINEFLNARGCILVEHTTNRNKWDVDFGVASMSTLFSGWQDDRQMIEFPSTVHSEMMRALVEQLTTWAPNLPKHHKTDMVMAMWFVEIACRNRIANMSMYSGRHHTPNPFATKYDLSLQGVVNMSDVERVWGRISA